MPANLGPVMAVSVGTSLGALLESRLSVQDLGQVDLNSQQFQVRSYQELRLI